MVRGRKERMPCGHTTDWLAWQPDHEELMPQVECIEGGPFGRPLTDREMSLLAQVLDAHRLEQVVP